MEDLIIDNFSEISIDLTIIDKKGELNESRNNIDSVNNIKHDSNNNDDSNVHTDDEKKKTNFEADEIGF